MFFLKYRPKTIAELDLEDVRFQLSKILEHKKIPQAFLFAGPKGSGKTSAARILAKAVNCLKPKKTEPCNSCDVCREINNGASLDVLEIDAASNRGIDDIRQLKEKIGLVPINASYKVYIIDEVHMLTREAFNALLKTLEEPPAHVIFILCTTNPEKIIATVLSRLIRIDFSKGSDKEVERSLKKVIKGEKLSVEKKVVKGIIGLSDGGFRDAQKTLEGLVLSFGKKLNWDKVKKKLSYWQKQKPESILVALESRDLKKGLQITEALSAEGVNFSDYLTDLLELVRQLILFKSGVVKLKGDWTKLAEKFTFLQLTKLSRFLSRALVEQKTTVLPQLPIQIALSEFIEIVGVSTSQASKPDLKEKEKETLEKGVERLSPENKAEEEGKRTDFVEQKPEQNSALVELEEIVADWQKLLLTVKPMNHSVAAFLRAARPKIIESGNVLVLEVFYPFHKERLEEDRNRRIVEDGLEKICGRGLRMKCVLGEKKPVSVATQQSQSFGSEKKQTRASGKNKDDDLYQMAKDIFGE